MFFKNSIYLYLDINITLDTHIYDFVCAENDMAGYKSKFSQEIG